MCGSCCISEWYDNDNSTYFPFGVYKKGGGVWRHCIDNPNDIAVYDDLIEELEASFWGNIHLCFQPTKFQRKFNHCFLPKMKEFAEKKLKIGKKDGYLMRATYLPMKKKEQVATIVEWLQITINPAHSHQTTMWFTGTMCIKQWQDFRQVCHYNHGIIIYQYDS